MYGVSEAEVLKAIGKAAITHVTGDDLVVLVGIGQAIKDGDTSVDDAFRSKNKPTLEETAKLTEEKRIKDHITNAETTEELEMAKDYILIDGRELIADMYNKKEKELKKKVESK